jgi:acyl-coenzyme A synthetase/AMP-(fatty) acid ligase
MAGYRGPRPPDRFNLARHCLTGKAASRRALVVSGDNPRSLDYGDVEESVLRLAGHFKRHGLCDGARCVLRLNSGLSYALVFLAAAAAGAVAIPTSPQLMAPELARLIALSGARFILHGHDLALPAVEHDVMILDAEDLLGLPGAPADYAETGPDHPAYLIFTSGTSGEPKGVLHGHRAIWGRAPMYQGWYGLSPDDVMLHTGAMNWTYGLGTGVLDCLVAGATAVIHEGARDAALWPALVRRHQVSILASVPGVYRQLLRLAPDFGTSLRHGLTAGEALPPSLLTRWTEQTGLPLYEGFGMTEISTFITSCPSFPVSPGSPGRPQAERMVTITDDGCLAVHRSDPGLMLGYADGASGDGDWFVTADAGHFDEDGYFWHEGRVDEIMNAGGFRVSPVEIDRVLSSHPLVADAAVAEIRVSAENSVIMAFIVPADPDHPPTDESLDAFARERLAGYKCPRAYHLRQGLPRTINGKTLRRQLIP